MFFMLHLLTMLGRVLNISMESLEVLHLEFILEKLQLIHLHSHNLEKLATQIHVVIKNKTVKCIFGNIVYLL